MPQDNHRSDPSRPLPRRTKARIMSRIETTDFATWLGGAPHPERLGTLRDLFDVGVGVSSRAGGWSVFAEEYDAGR